MFSMRWCSSLLSGLTVAALLAGMPAVDADSRSAPAGGEFTLQSVQGPVNLGDLRGKVVLLFFGYTSCPDICPLSLARIGACLSSLEEEQAQRVSALFITLDPGRDTVERMRQYAGFFTPGSSGSPATSRRSTDVTARYGSPGSGSLRPSRRSATRSPIPIPSFSSTPKVSWQARSEARMAARHFAGRYWNCWRPEGEGVSGSRRRLCASPSKRRSRAGRGRSGHCRRLRASPPKCRSGAGRGHSGPRIPAPRFPGGLSGLRR